MEHASSRRLRTAMVVVVLVAVPIVLALAGTARASGGGGCGRPVTDASGTTVAIRTFCFTPTVVRTEPGRTVTFRNADPVPHTILGANGVWGSFDQLRRGQDVTYRFGRSGVYPYVCTFHPGMVGVVVVGDAGGPGAAGTTTTAEGPVTLAVATRAPATDVRAAVPDPVDPGSVGAWPAVAAVGFGLFLATSAALAAERRRREAGA